MNIKDIRQLVKLMVDGDLSELDITEGDHQVHLKRGYEQVQVVQGPASVPASMPAPAPAPAAPAAPADTSGESAPPAPPADDLLEIKSPMVGTFYAAPSPDSDSYASVGDQIDEESVVCIVEAMKVMNEIKAECSGTIAEICVKNAQPVEFGQVLFRVKPA
jgi:acetyl-CoA carboxylase biotin carboxyl carrier protein